MVNSVKSFAHIGDGNVCNFVVFVVYCGFINYLRFEIEVRIRKEVTKNLCRGGRNCEVSAGEDVYITSWVGLRGWI